LPNAIGYYEYLKNLKLKGSTNTCTLRVLRGEEGESGSASTGGAIILLSEAK